LYCSYAPPASPAIFSLSLHDALPISGQVLRLLGDQGASDDAEGIQLFWHPTRPPFPLGGRVASWRGRRPRGFPPLERLRPSSAGDRKSTRLNSSHVAISYAVFCLKKK